MSSFLRFGFRLGFRLGLCLTCLPVLGCGRIDVGPDTGPPGGCEAPAPFFVSDVWPKYFQTGAISSDTCGRSDCHDASTGHGFVRLQPVDMVPAPQPTDPISIWPTAWAANLRAVETNVSCANPCQSVLIVVPSGGGQPHPGGNIVKLTDACALFTMWLK